MHHPNMWVLEGYEVDATHSTYKQGLISLVRGGDNAIDDAEKESEVSVVSTTFEHGQMLKDLVQGEGSHCLIGMEYR